MFAVGDWLLLTRPSLDYPSRSGSPAGSSGSCVLGDVLRFYRESGRLLLGQFLDRPEPLDNSQA
jgi:hypothetical protein